VKNNSILFAVLVLLGGCGNAETKPDLSNTAPEKDPLESAVEWSKLQDRNGDAYIPNTDKPYSGWAKRTFENGQVEILAEFTDGTVTRLQQWQENGIPKWDLSFTVGKMSVSDVPIDDFWDIAGFNTREVNLLNGDFTVWYKNGQKELAGEYKGMTCVDNAISKGYFPAFKGLPTVWYDNGQKASEEHLKNYKADGLGTVWYENGQKKEEVNWKDGKMDELITKWYKNGQIQCEISYEVGKIIAAKVWQVDGNRCKESDLTEGSGRLISYNSETGAKLAEIKYKDSKLMVPKEIDKKLSNGNRIKYGELNGKRVGNHQLISSEGKIKTKGQWQDDKKHGIWTTFYDNEKVHTRSSFKNDKLVVLK
jgi:antitoxin component YwqK of YwqJK toxin-antitoxin module